MMAGPAPSSLFTRLANVWRDLSLRCDVDDIVLELLGKFSLEKIYAEAGDTETYQRLVISLLSQLNAIFYIQRLTLPTENVHVGRYLGLLVSWEVTVRCVEFVLQVVTDGREGLWESRQLRDKYLAEFLLSSLRIMTLHPRALTSQRARERRERYARIHKSLEQVFDSYPGDKSFLLLVSKEVTHQLCVDPNSITLPQRLRFELPNLTSELYPLEECLSSQYISEIVSRETNSESWLYEFLTLRDISHFVIGASVQYTANQETRDVRLFSSSARSRNAVLRALENVRLPPHLSKSDLVTTFNSTFRIILPDTLDLASDDSSDSSVDDFELDALDQLGARLTERQIIHRVSDGEMMHGMSQVIREVVLQDNPSGHFGTGRPSLLVLDCPECHLVGGAQLRANDIEVPFNLDGGLCRLLPDSLCPVCEEPASVAREVSLARRTWEILRPLETDSETINVERHLPTQFHLQPPKTDTDLYDRHSPRPQAERLILPSRTQTAPTRTDSQDLLSPVSPHATIPFRNERVMSDTSTYIQSERENQVESTLGHTMSTPLTLSDTKRHSQESLPRRKSETTQDKPKSRWRLPFGSMKKSSTPQPTVTSGDSSSLSSGGTENQKLEEIPLGSLIQGSKSKSRAAKVIHTCLSQNSTLALFWSQLQIQIWDVGPSPPTIMRGIPTDSTCILATVAKVHAAYIIGTRDQKLTLRIVNLEQPSTPVVEYRMPSSPWCKSIAIDRNENYVAVGFEESIVRFFKTTSMEHPREDRLHAPLHDDCKHCPAVDTLSFSHDGLALLASTRSHRTGLIKLYLWRFPFLTFHELTSCRYHVRPHESEDNGISSALLQSGHEGTDNLICVTTWTQSGTPVLVQPRGGHKAPIQPEASVKHGKVGSRIQHAAFSPSGQELALVNDKGHLYQINHINSSPLDIKRVATSKELTAKSPSFAMGYMTMGDEDAIVMAWADSSKMAGWIKKIPVSRTNPPPTPGHVYDIAAYPAAKPKDLEEVQREPAELSAEHVPRELDATEQSPEPVNEEAGKKTSKRFQGFFEYGL